MPWFRLRRRRCPPPRTPARGLGRPTPSAAWPWPPPCRLRRKPVWSRCSTTKAELRQAPGAGPLLDELKLIERHRAFTRQVFNQAVEQYNDALRQMPTRLLTPLFGFRPARSL